MPSKKTATKKAPLKKVTTAKKGAIAKTAPKKTVAVKKTLQAKVATTKKTTPLKKTKIVAKKKAPTTKVATTSKTSIKKVAVPKKTPTKTQAKLTKSKATKAVAKAVSSKTAEKFKPCCPVFDTKKYEGKTHNWKNKKFVKDSVFSFFHIPFGIGKKMDEMWEKIGKAKAITKIKNEDVLILFNDPSPFKGDIYISVDSNVPNLENVVISGTLISKVYDGPYNAAPKFIKDMDLYLDKKGKKALLYYMHYSYCPLCAKHYGHNYSVLFAKLN